MKTVTELPAGTYDRFANKDILFSVLGKEIQRGLLIGPEDPNAKAEHYNLKLVEINFVDTCFSQRSGWQSLYGNEGVEFVFRDQEKDLVLSCGLKEGIPTLLNPLEVSVTSANKNINWGGILGSFYGRQETLEISGGNLARIYLQSPKQAP